MALQDKSHISDGHDGDDEEDEEEEEVKEENEEEVTEHKEEEKKDTKTCAEDAPEEGTEGKKIGNEESAIKDTEGDDADLLREEEIKQEPKLSLNTKSLDENGNDKIDDWSDDEESEEESLPKNQRVQETNGAAISFSPVSLSFRVSMS